MTWNFGGYRSLFESLTEGAKHTDPRLRRAPETFTAAAVAGYLARLLVDASARWIDRHASPPPARLEA